MALTINTNLSAIIAQRNLNNATGVLNSSIERMSTGYKINHAGDNAAGYSIANMWLTQLGSLDVAADNAATGADLLTTAEQTYSLLTGHLQRVRDLTEQAANGTYGSTSLKAIQGEIVARLEEITRISANSEFNGIKLMAYTAGAKDIGMTSNGINLQVGLYADENSAINLAVDLFKDASVSGLLFGMTGLSTLLNKANASFTGKYNSASGYEMIAAACSGLKVEGGKLVLQVDPTAGAKEMLSYVDDAIDEISRRVTKIGAAQNRVDSAISSIDVQNQNLTSSLSTLRDTDVAEESSKYLQAQILQQATATLLSTANQTPSIALNLV